MNPLYSWDFITPLSNMERSSRQKIRKEIVESTPPSVHRILPTSTDYFN